MAFAASSYQPVRASSDATRSTSVCRVHSCVRCGASVDSVAPCSFVTSVVSVCRLCRGQEQVLFHLPTARNSWAANLALGRR
jgi:hypothetical protein